MIKLLLFGFIGLTSAQTCLTVSNAERQALIDLYNATGGANWTNNKNWNTNAPVCDWHGVLVTQGKVTRLTLTNNNLTGALPSSIGNLTNLQYIYLDQNNISGRIPEEIGDLTGLIYINLATNKLEGNLPESIGNLTLLKYLHLFTNNLSGNIPAAITTLNNLQYLSLHQNQFTGEIPRNIGDLNNLIFLYLHQNKLTGSIPSSVTNLSRLTRLYVSNNQLTGEIPTDIDALTKLDRLYVYDNQLTGAIPESLTKLSDLTYFIGYKNKLSGSIPHNLGDLSKLKHVSLYRNQLTGEIPSSIVELSNLEYLNLSDNKLTGAIPDVGIDRLTKLARIYLQGNQLSGIIPEGLGKLLELTHVHLAYNQLEGTLPGSFRDLNKLIMLHVYDNQLSGTIPDFTTISSLDQLVIGKNQFSFTNLLANHSTYQSTLNTYTYAPQKKIDNEDVVLLELGKALLLQTSLANPDNTYQWFKEGKAISGATEAEYRIDNASKSDVGTYHVEVNNNNISNLKLTRNNLYIKESGGNNEFCSSEFPNGVITINDLTPSGPSIRWYLAETGGTPLGPDFDITLVFDEAVETLWWLDASSGSNTRTTADVYINEDTPDGEEIQYFSAYINPAPVINDIVVYNDNQTVYWYAQPYGGNELVGTTALIHGMTYYASSCDKKTGTCLCRLPVTVYLGVLTPTGDGVQYLCKGASLSDVVVEIEAGFVPVWYTQPSGGSSINPGTIVEQGGSYYVAQRNTTTGEESIGRLMVTIYHLIIPEPEVLNSTQTFYLYNGTPLVQDLLAIGANITWYNSLNGGTPYNPLDALNDGYYYAQQQPGACPSPRTRVLVIISDEEAPGLLGCDLFKPELTQSYVISAWVNEREVVAEVDHAVDFDGSPEQELFKDFLNYMVNRMRSSNRAQHDIPDVFVPTFEGDEVPLDLERLLPFLNGLNSGTEKIFTVYNFNYLYDSYGRTIGFTFNLTDSGEHTFTYQTPFIRRNGEVESERYPLLDNVGPLKLIFTDVYLDVNGQFIAVSDFEQTASPAYSEIGRLDILSEAGVLPTATFYNYNEVAFQQSMQYENAKIRIEFKNEEGIIMSNQTLEFSPKGAIIDNWQRIASDFRIPDGSGQMVVSLINTSEGKISYFDDLRILPYDGSMKTFVYHPETQRLMSELDENNYATYYEYDKEGGLIRVKKETERGVFTIQETRSASSK